MRRSQLISPWGVGAIVPFPEDETLMIAGLDMWRYGKHEDFRIKDERLERRLSISELRWPADFRDPSSDPENALITIPAVRFPRWHYCPYCGTMKKSGLYSGPLYCDQYQWTSGRKCSPSKYSRKLVQERFIVICPNGHIDDFPIPEWLHYNHNKSYDPESCRIRRSTGGMSASLSGVTYECSCGAKKSLQGAFNRGGLGRIGYHCTGHSPWLGKVEDQADPCECSSNDVRVVQRGASNVWFADTVSSIFIPIDKDNAPAKIIGIMDKHADFIFGSRVNGHVDETKVKLVAELEKIDFELLYEAVLQREIGQVEMEKINETTTEDEYRLAEYKVLTKDSGGPAFGFHSRNINISEYSELMHTYFRSVSLVPVLKETRAFAGFSRLLPGEPVTRREKEKRLRLGNESWLPAIEVKGEGILIDFNRDALDRWLDNPRVNSRLASLNKAYQKTFLAQTMPGILNAEYVLIHTFAHLLINQLSYECGYGSSSIRERLYIERCGDERQMDGVLIYTASGDSEGSLGGLVRQGKPGRLENTIAAAVENARWCSSDPICIGSRGQGPDSTNLAACHNCALLPETSCEVGNRLLDRGLIIGIPEDPAVGFFHELRL